MLRYYRHVRAVAGIILFPHNGWYKEEFADSTFAALAPGNYVIFMCEKQQPCVPSLLPWFSLAQDVIVCAL